MAMFRFDGWTPLTTRSLILISPEVMPSSPAIMFRSVDLPQPDGPTSTRNSPSSTEISTRCSTSTAP
jgi:hypothetical protein